MLWWHILDQSGLKTGQSLLPQQIIFNSALIKQTYITNEPVAGELL